MVVPGYQRTNPTESMDKVAIINGNILVKQKKRSFKLKSNILCFD